MKTISNSLLQFLLNNTVFNRAYLITITLPNGQVLNVLDGTNIDVTLSTNINASSLCGGWADDNGELVATPFQIGNSWSELCPQGATQLLLGVQDTIIWSDNSGSWVINVNPGNTNHTVVGTSQPWIFKAPSGAPINGAFTYDTSGGAGTAPVAIPVTTGVVYTLSYVSGTVSRKPGTFALYDANGASTPQAPSNSNTFGWPGYWFANSFPVPTTFYSAKYGAWTRGVFTNEASFKLEAKSLELTALISESVLYPGTSTPMMQVINQGVFNGALVSIQTLYWPINQLPSSGFSMGLMQLTVGQIGNIKSSGRSKVVFEVFDMTYLLNKPVPPHYIQSACRHSLFDAGCTLSASNFQTTAIPLAANSTTLNLNLNLPARANSTGYGIGNPILVAGVIYVCSHNGVSGLSAPTFNTAAGAITFDGGVQWRSMNGMFPLGYVQCVSGQNNGLKASVKAQITIAGVMQFQLLKPLPFAVTTGDTFILVPGCDKTMGTCVNVYNNLIHFGGQPFVPNPEVAQ